MRRTRFFAGFLLAVSMSLFAQPPARSVARPATGTVTGRVYCSDTRQPGRLASVMLQPVVTPDIVAGAQARPAVMAQAPSSVVQTLMDGSFTIPNVAPGDYYVIAELPGYLSPLSIFSRDDLNHPSKQTADLMKGLLTPVSVTANNSARADVSLVKGATIGGIVRFEDGMPDERSTVRLLRRDATGKMKDYHPTSVAAETVKTDDQGRFRFAGLPAGEYKMYTTLAIQNGEVSSDKSGWHGGLDSGPSDPSWLNVYFGNVFREGEGKSITLTGGEQLGGDDIEVQLSKLHSVSGSVVDAATGAAVNQATVRIRSTVLGTHGGSAQIGRTEVAEDGSFHFPFVPEGVYNLTVGDAREITHDQVPIQMAGPPAITPLGIEGEGRVMTWVPMRQMDKTAKTYADTTQPLIVHSDIAGITVQVTVKPPAVAAQ